MRMMRRRNVTFMMAMSLLMMDALELVSEFSCVD